MALIVLTESPATPPAFVAFWAQKYDDPNEPIYTGNIIKANRTPESLSNLFFWKIGKRLFTHSFPSVTAHFISRQDEVDRLPEDTSAEEFLKRFGEGGAIWRIFWLHCWNQRFPIYDQHVHRAMTFIEDGKGEELDRYSNDSQKINLYLKRYLRFFKQFDGIDGRRVDKALWAFGKFIKGWHSPRESNGQFG